MFYSVWYCIHGGCSSCFSINESRVTNTQLGFSDMFLSGFSESWFPFSLRRFYQEKFNMCVVIWTLLPFCIGEWVSKSVYGILTLYKADLTSESAFLFPLFQYEYLNLFWIGHVFNTVIIFLYSLSSFLFYYRHMMWEQVRVTAVRRQGDIATAQVRALAHPPMVRLPGATTAV